MLEKMCENSNNQLPTSSSCANVNGFREHTITSQVDVDELMKENKIFITRANVDKPTSSFNTRMEMETPSGKLSTLAALLMMSI